MNVLHIIDDSKHGQRDMETITFKANKSLNAFVWLTVNSRHSFNVYFESDDLFGANDAFHQATRCNYCCISNGMAIYCLSTVCHSELLDTLLCRFPHR